jgi:hypothetical protein
VQIVLLRAGQVHLLAEAELRLNPARPWKNRAVLMRGAVALIQQGALSRPGRAIAGAERLRGVSIAARGMVRWFWQVFLPSLGTVAFNRRHRRQWSIGLLRASEVTLPEQGFPWERVRWIEPPDDGIIADPFLVRGEDGTDWLFYERMLFSEARGTLWAARLDPSSLTCHDATEVLMTQVHLSFPNVFRHQGAWYMLPEQARSGATLLYRSAGLPGGWAPYRTLLDGFPGIDPVLYFHADAWWLFVTHGKQPCNENNLHLFYADSLEDEFKPHPMNPVVTGLKGSRMAGRILQQFDRLVRPGQDGRRAYGGGVVLFEILQLDKTTYRERELVCWGPEADGPYAAGFHTFVESDGWLVIDGQRLLPR